MCVSISGNYLSFNLYSQKIVHQLFTQISWESSLSELYGWNYCTTFAEFTVNNRVTTWAAYNRPFLIHLENLFFSSEHQIQLFSTKDQSIKVWVWFEMYRSKLDHLHFHLACLVGSTNKNDPVRKRSSLLKVPTQLSCWNLFLGLSIPITVSCNV